MIIIHDLDGSVLDTPKLPYDLDPTGGQILFSNPNYVAPAPVCFPVVDLGDQFYFCPSAVARPFKTYSGLWRDYGPQILAPLIVTTPYAGADNNRTYGAYGPTEEMCSKRMPFSRYPMLIPAGKKTRIAPTASNMNLQSWLLRWDAPSADDSAVIEFFIPKSLVINVFVGSSENGDDFVYVPPFSDHYPALSDLAGANTRDPQRRTLTVSIRGGSKNFYMFREIPVVQVNMRMEMEMVDFFSSSFVANIATLLDIRAYRISIAEVRRGSVIVNYRILPSVKVAINDSQVISQVNELTQVTTNLTSAVSNGRVERRLNVTLLEAYAINPVPPIRFDELYTPDDNSTYNATAARLALIQSLAAANSYLYTYTPTYLPSFDPTPCPSSSPSRQPSSQPFR